LGSKGSGCTCFALSLIASGEIQGLLSRVSTELFSGKGVVVHPHDNRMSDILSRREDTYV